MENEIQKLADAINQALIEYENVLESNNFSEREIDNYMTFAEEIAPESFLSDLYFYGEKNRTREEIAYEAAYRQYLFERSDKKVLIEHVMGQMRSALENSESTDLNKACAEDTLKYMHELIL
jgi:hypothetical protein